MTGAASGMGRATTELLLAHGWTVLGIDVCDVDIACDSPGANGPGPGTLLTARADITDREALTEAFHDALGSPDTVSDPRIDLVANIAGVFPPSTLDTFTEERYRLTFDVNVLGTLNVIAAARPYLRRESSVVNFASVDAFTVSPGQLLYGASKAAVVMLTKELALELAPFGIRVNAIAPGWVDTPGNSATGRMAEAAASVPLGRVTQPSEIARWVEIIGGPDAGFLSGETVVLSGADVMR